MRKLVKPAHDDPDNSVDLFDADRENKFGGMHCVAPAILQDQVAECWNMYVHDESWTCSRCGSTNDVDSRYSFDVYAGRLCRQCCFRYRDHCGIDQEQGRPSTLIAEGETYYEEDY